MGGRSGYTFEEAASWAGLKQGIKVQLFSDATIKVPLMVQALRVWGKRHKSVLVFDWSEEDLELGHIKRSGRWRVSFLTVFFP